MAIFLFNFSPQQAGVISTFFFLQWAGVTSTGLPTPTFHKSAQLEVISFSLFVSCPIRPPKALFATGWIYQHIYLAGGLQYLI